MHALDVVVLVLYFALTLGMAWWFGRGQTSLSNFFVGNRQVPWLAVMLSILATEISAVTFVAVPATGFRENWNYLQFGIGSLVGRFFIAFLFLPAFYKYDCTSIYEFLYKRFGRASRYSAVVFFFLTRLLASGVRFLAASVGLGVVLAGTTPLTPWQGQMAAIVFLMLVAIAYTTFGGIKAVIWTDVLQALVFLGGAAIVVGYLVWHVSGGIPAIWSAAGAAGHTEIFRFHLAGGANLFTDANFFYIAFLNGLVMTFAALGTDQDLTQRMLTCKNFREARKSLITTGFLSLPVVAMFLFIGTALYAFYQQNPALAANLPDASDRIFPYFIIQQLPAGLKGLLVAGMLAAAMSSVDSALGALSSSAIIDVYRPLVRPDATEAHYMWVSRLCVVGFGLILAGIAWALMGQDEILWLAFQMGSLTYGALLGVFLLGVLLPENRGSNLGNMVAMCTSLCLTVPLLVGIRMEWIALGWTWLVIFGTLWTFLVGTAAAYLAPPRTV